MIYLCGDTHGLIDVDKLSADNFDYSTVSKDDYLIILGDFGGLFYNDIRDEETLKFFNSLPLQVLWIDGNHENFDVIESYPIEEWHGGKIHRITDNIIHLMRGQIFTIEDLTFFTFGGGASIDKAMRREGISWWPQEMPSQEEMDEGLNNLELANWKVDYVLTHSAPLKLLKEIVPYAYGDVLNRYLDTIDDNLTYKHWYLGHYHKDKDYENFSILYNIIQTLE